MFPHIMIFLKQTRRSTKRLVLQIGLLCAVTGFFAASLNLFFNSWQNLLTVENSYTTIATMEIYGYINEEGDLVDPGDESCVGRHWLSVEDYDLSPLLALDSVKSIHLRTRVGAYIPEHVPVFCTKEDNPDMADGWVQLFATSNVIRFTLDSEEPIVIPLQETQHQYLDFPIHVVETSNSLLKYPDTFTLRFSGFDAEELAGIADDILRLNRNDCFDSLILYPEVEYVLLSSGGSNWERDPASNTYIWKNDLSTSYYAPIYDGLGLSFYGTDYYEKHYLCYNKNGLIVQFDASFQSAPFALQRYEDVKNDPNWAEYTQAAQYSASSFAVSLTEDVSLIPAWYQNAMYLIEGRMITEEEYASGAKVCMVSAKMAAHQGWQVGDKLEMHLYAYDAFLDQTSIIQSGFIIPQNYLPRPSYLKSCSGFFEEDTYEIVGIYGQKEFGDFSETAPEVYYSPWNAIYIPTNAAPNAPDGPIQPSLITIELKNGGIDAFKAAVEDLGLTEQKPGEYEIKFSYFDQGYTKIQPGLIEMNRNAKLLLGLSSALLVVTMVLTAFLFAQQHKHSAGILRMLGGSKKQAFASILTCAAVVVSMGGVTGTILGGVLTQSVGASILGDTASTAIVPLHTGADPVLAALTALGCIVLFLCLTAICAGTYIGKEPSALLPSSKR